MSYFKPYRWSDNQKQVGPFIFSKDYPGWDVCLRRDMYSTGRTAFQVKMCGYNMLVMLPPIIKYKHAYGFSLHENRLEVNYGVQRDMSDDSTVPHNSKSWFLPWNEYHFVSYTLFDLDLDVFWKEVVFWGERKRTVIVNNAYENSWEARETQPSRTFEFKDFDGEVISAKCTIEQRYWTRGEGKFQWMRYFFPDKTINSMDIRFSSEVGRRKGSWKGGTIGHGIDMISLHEDLEEAFKRYCVKRELTYLREIK